MSEANRIVREKPRLMRIPLVTASYELFGSSGSIMDGATFRAFVCFRRILRNNDYSLRIEDMNHSTFFSHILFTLFHITAVSSLPNPWTCAILFMNSTLRASRGGAP